MVESKLNFKIVDERSRMSELADINLDEKYLQSYLDKENQRYSTLIYEINKSGAYLKLSVSQDGRRIEKASIVGTADLLDKVQLLK